MKVVVVVVVDVGVVVDVVIDEGRRGEEVTRMAIGAGAIRVVLCSFLKTHATMST